MGKGNPELTRKRHAERKRLGLCQWGLCPGIPVVGRLCPDHRERSMLHIRSACAKQRQLRDQRQAIADENEPTAGLKPLDFIMCIRCGLRGHVPGDPDRCLFGSALRGLGGEQGAQTPGRRATGQR